MVNPNGNREVFGSSTCRAPLVRCVTMGGSGAYGQLGYKALKLGFPSCVSFVCVFLLLWGGSPRLKFTRLHDFVNLGLWSLIGMLAGHYL